MTIHYLVEGDGRTVVLLHAGVADLRMWGPADRRPGRRRRQPGGPLRPAWLRLNSAGAGCALWRCGRRPGAGRGAGPDIVRARGASYGGYVAQQVATALPDQVERLVLVCTAGDLVEPDASLRAFWQEERRLLEVGDLDGATELNVATWLGPDADDDARILVRTMQRAAFDHQLAAGHVDDRELPVIPEVLAMPVTMIVGAHDFDFFGDTARALVSRLPRAELVELEWAGHLPTLERPDEGRKVLLGLLAD